MDGRYLTFLGLAALYLGWVQFEWRVLSQPLYAISLAHIRIFRAHADQHKFMDVLMTLLSQLGDKFGLFGAMSISHHFNNEGNSFISSTQLCVFVLISQTVKSIIREPRPLMVDGAINVEDCKHMEFGNPSSHVYGATFMWITCVYLLCKDYIYKHRIQGAGPTVLKIIHVVFVVLFIVAFSRVYKGVHSYNQVLSGFIQGLLATAIQILVLYYSTYRFFHSIKDRSLIRLIFNRFTIGYAFLFYIGLQVHFDTEANFKVPQEWIENVKKNCGTDDLIAIDPETANFQKLFLSLGIIGIYLGVILEQKYLDSRHYPYFYETDFQTSVKRFIVCTLCGAVTQLPNVLISKKNPFWIVIVFKTFLPPALGSFYLFACSKSVAIYFGLANTTKKYKYVDEMFEAMYMKEQWAGQDRTPINQEKKDKKA
jgi:hypothetical protein